MMVQEAGSIPNPGRMVAATPPYAAYVTFDAFTRRAASEPLPLVIDKALLIDWGVASGNESGLLTSLRSLGIIDENNRPTDLYHQLRLSPPRRIAALRRCAEIAYPGLPNETVDPIDPNVLHDYFVETRGLTGQMVEKASRFYRNLITIVSTGATSEVSTARAAPARPRTSSTPAQMRLAAIDLPPQPAQRRGRMRAVSAKRSLLAMSIGVQVQIPADFSETDLVELFGRIQSAWAKASRRSTIP